MSDCDEVMTYIGRRPCGCVVMAVLDDAEDRERTARAVSRAIREGLTIERVTSAYVQASFRNCPHASSAAGDGAPS